MTPVGVCRRGRHRLARCPSAGAPAPASSASWGPRPYSASPLATLAPLVAARGKGERCPASRGVFFRLTPCGRKTRAWRYAPPSLGKPSGRTPAFSATRLPLCSLSYILSLSSKSFTLRRPRTRPPRESFSMRTLSTIYVSEKSAREHKAPTTRPIIDTIRKKEGGIHCQAPLNPSASVFHDVIFYRKSTLVR